MEIKIYLLRLKPLLNYQERDIDSEEYLLVILSICYPNISDISYFKTFSIFLKMFLFFYFVVSTQFNSKQTFLTLISKFSTKFG